MSDLIEKDHRNYEYSPERRKAIEQIVHQQFARLNTINYNAMYSDDGKTVGSRMKKCRSGDR